MKRKRKSIEFEKPESNTAHRVHVLDLPLEVLHHILMFVDATCLGCTIPRVCKTFRECIENDQFWFQFFQHRSRGTQSQQVFHPTVPKLSKTPNHAPVWKRHFFHQFSHVFFEFKPDIHFFDKVIAIQTIEIPIHNNWKTAVHKLKFCICCYFFWPPHKVNFEIIQRPSLPGGVKSTIWKNQEQVTESPLMPKPLTEIGFIPGRVYTLDIEVKPGVPISQFVHPVSFSRPSIVCYVDSYPNRIE